MIQAVGKNIVVKAIKEDKKTGILIPNQTEKTLYWLVLSVGDEVENIKVNDHVLINPYEFYGTTITEETLLIGDFNKVLAKTE